MMAKCTSLQYKSSYFHYITLNEVFSVVDLNQVYFDSEEVLKKFGYLLS